MGQANSSNVQFAGNADWNWIKLLIQHIDSIVGKRPANGNKVRYCIDAELGFEGSCDHAGFAGAVSIEPAHARPTEFQPG